MFHKIIIRKISFSSLKEYMKKKKLSRKDLAIELGITQQYLSMYFNGRRNFSTKLALSISKKTGIPIENLIQ